MNDFILNDALPYRKEKLGVTYVYVEKENLNNVAAFFCLSNDSISLTDFDSKTKYNKFSRRFNNRKRLKSYFPSESMSPLTPADARRHGQPD